MRNALSRVLLVALLGVAIFTLVQVTAERTDAVVAIEGIRPERLEHEAFRVDEPALFAIDAAGSFEEVGSGASDTTLAAYAWIVRREDRTVAWQMRPDRPDRGTFVSLRDTVRLLPGTYDAYFTSYGDPLVRAPGPRDGSIQERIRAALSRGGRSWVGDAGRWRFVMAGLTPAARAARNAEVEARPDQDLPEGDSLLVWRALGVRNHSRRHALLQVTEPAQVRVRALTEATDGVVADKASIVRLGTRDTVWAARDEGTTWAGGSVKNRLIEEDVFLSPGIYRVAYEADRSHAYRGWEANPPLVPWAWGIELHDSAASGAVAKLDAAALDLPTIAEIPCVGPNESREVVFMLSDSTDVIAVSVGEVAHGSVYDFGGLDRDDEGEWDEVWEMAGEDLEPAGGADKNRRAVAALSLAPGTYRLRYETDGSHDCESGYNSGGGPDAPLWGAVLYAADPAFDLGQVERPDAPAPDTTDVELDLDSEPESAARDTLERAPEPPGERDEAAAHPSSPPDGHVDGPTVAIVIREDQLETVLEALRQGGVRVDSLRLRPAAGLQALPPPSRLG